MKPDEYLSEILRAQTLAEGGAEIRAMERHRDDVTKLLNQAFEKSRPTIKYGGSRAKGTMIKDNYDLDIICYFENEDREPGDTLEEIFNNSKAVLEEQYTVEARTSALRIKSKGKETLGEDFHVDVVPGRFLDKSRSDAYLYVKSREKGRQKTNLKKHLDHIKNSGVVDTIRLAKLWNFREGIGLKTFVLELLVIKALNGKKEASSGLSDCLTSFWRYVSENRNSLTVEDPANPYGNDLSDYIDSIQERLADVADDCIKLAFASKWESIFGAVDTLRSAPRIEVLSRTVQSQVNPAKPWLKPHNPGL